MEKKPKKKGFKKVLVCLLIIIVLIVVFIFGRKILNNINDNRVKKSLESLNEEIINYVFVSINPYFLLTVKNNKVVNVTCLNIDCEKIHNDIKVEGKNINDSINSIYELTKENGYDTTNVNIKTTGNINIDKKDYMTIEYIDETEKNNLLKDTNKDNFDENLKYYKDLWNELKKDQDYGYVYNCRMEDGELKCFINVKEDLIMGLDDEDMGLSRLDDFRRMLIYNSRMVRVFNKFGIKTASDTDQGFFFELDSIYINDKELKYNIYDWYLYDYNNNGVNYYIELSDLNLLNPGEALNKLKLQPSE